MAENNILLDIQSQLKKYFSYFKHENILTIAEDKATLPFIHLIVDENYPDFILLSISVDYPNSINVTEVALIANSVEPVALSEPFYISQQDGSTYFGDEAYVKWDNDSFDLESIDPISNTKH